MKDTQINDVRILHESLRTEKAELARYTEITFMHINK